MTLRKHLRLGLALGSAAMLATSLAGCYGSSSSTALQPGLQQSVASVSHETKTQKRAAPPEIINQFVSVPPGTATPTNFEIVLKGNLVNAICGPSNPPCLDQPLYGPYNPFCPPSGGPCYPTVTYNPSTNTTTVEYSGPTLYQNIPGHTNYYHFGLFAGPSSTGSVKGLEVTSYWSYASSPNVPQPIVSINSGNTLQKSANWAYALVFIGVATSPKGPAVYGTWNEVAYIPNGSNQPKLSFKNYGNQTLYVVSAGIAPNQQVPSDPSCQSNPSCQENLSLLSQETFVGEPPPGESGSPFIPLQYPPSSVLKPTKP